MDNAATVALSAALELEFASLQHRLLAMSKKDQADVLEASINELLENLPEALSSIAKASYSAQTLEGILATQYAEGLATAGVGPVHVTGKLMRPEKAYEAVRRSHILTESPNTVVEAENAIRVRAAAVVKVLKGKIIQDLREKVALADANGVEQAQAILATAAKGLADLSTNSHVQHHVEVQGQLAKGYGLYSGQQTKAYLDAVPFQEFYRAEHREEWRDWPARWKEQGGKFYNGVSDYPEGRMIAEVQSKIWSDLSNPSNYEDGTGSPYPPFAYGSGMGVKPVTMKEAAKLGLLGKHRIPPKPKKLQFNAGISFSVDFDDDIKESLLDSMTDWVEKQEGEVVHQ